MIRDAIDYNWNVNPGTFEVERLRTVLPEYFDNNGRFMIDRLQQALQDGDVDLTREGYERECLIFCVWGWFIDSWRSGRGMPLRVG